MRENDSGARTAGTPGDVLAVLTDYIAIARPEHWIKNIFMILGTVLALLMHPRCLDAAAMENIGVALAAACLVASSNYVLNEILDAARDREHPEKRTRPIARGAVPVRGAYAEWFVLGFAGLALGWRVSPEFFFSALALWGMGIIYNVPPIRSKEVPILDVLSEAINNPIRLLMGWYAVGLSVLPPSSIVLAYWMFGAFAMAAKRLAEYREIGDGAVAAAYRNSFSWYNEDRLVMTIVAYASGFMFFFALLIGKYHPELILCAPFIMVFMAYVVKLTYEPDSVMQHPERLFQRPWFAAYSLFCLGLMIVLALTSIPWVRHLFLLR